MICSATCTLHQTEVKDTGRQLLGLRLSPFVKIRQTLADFKFSDVWPFSMDVWKILVSAGVTGRASYFRNLVDISSGPVALLGLRLVRRFNTPFTVTVMSSVVGKVL